MRTLYVCPPRPDTALKIALAGVLLAGAGLLSPARAELPPLQHQGNVEYVSGGIGIDESTSFKEAMSRYPLSLTFDSPDNGAAAYVANVQVVIQNSHDATVLDATSQGPYFLVKLPPGKYHVKATYQNDTQSREVAIGEKGSERLVFSWKRPKAGPD